MTIRTIHFNEYRLHKLNVVVGDSKSKFGLEMWGRNPKEAIKRAKKQLAESFGCVDVVIFPQSVKPPQKGE